MPCPCSPPPPVHATWPGPVSLSQQEGGAPASLNWPWELRVPASPPCPGAPGAGSDSSTPQASRLPSPPTLAAWGPNKAGSQGPHSTLVTESQHLTLEIVCLANATPQPGSVPGPEAEKLGWGPGFGARDPVLSLSWLAGLLSSPPTLYPPYLASAPSMWGGGTLRPQPRGAGRRRRGAGSEGLLWPSAEGQGSGPSSFQ